MIISRYCKGKVYVYCANEGMSFYVCKTCQIACDTVMALGMENDSHVEHGREAEAKVSVS